MFSIMLIEDNPDHAMLAADCLTDQDHDIDVLCRSNAEDALSELKAIAADDGALPNLLLVDINMPGMNGFAFLHRIKTDERLCRVPAIMLSSSSNPSDILKALREHANSYITKSTDFIEWEESLKAICDYWFVHDRSHLLEEHTG